jgi:hypothetical protein
VEEPVAEQEEPQEEEQQTEEAGDEWVPEFVPTDQSRDEQAVLLARMLFPISSSEENVRTLSEFLDWSIPDIPVAEGFEMLRGPFIVHVNSSLSGDTVFTYEGSNSLTVLDLKIMMEDKAPWYQQILSLGDVGEQELKNNMPLSVLNPSQCTLKWHVKSRYFLDVDIGSCRNGEKDLFEINSETTVWQLINFINKKYIEPFIAETGTFSENGDAVRYLYLGTERNLGYKEVLKDVLPPIKDDAPFFFTTVLGTAPHGDLDDFANVKHLMTTGGTWCQNPTTKEDYEGFEFSNWKRKKDNDDEGNNDQAEDEGQTREQQLKTFFQHVPEQGIKYAAIHTESDDGIEAQKTYCPTLPEDPNVIKPKTKNKGVKASTGAAASTGFIAVYGDLRLIEEEWQAEQQLQHEQEEEESTLTEEWQKEQWRQHGEERQSKGLSWQPGGMGSKRTLYAT